MSQRRAKLESDVFAIGDWIRFYRGGALVIGVIEYVEDQWPKTPPTLLHTNVGTAYPSEILERRDSPRAAARSPHAPEHGQ